MEDELVRAIYAFTSHVRGITGLAHDTFSEPTSEEEERRFQAIQNVCDEMEAFAQMSLTERTTFRDFERLRQKNHDVATNGTNALLKDVASAFLNVDRLE